MDPKWLKPSTFAEAIAAQKEMAQKVLLEERNEQSISLIGGVDVSQQPFDPEQKIFSALVVLSYPSLLPVETKTAEERQDFPYIPGLLGFREAPALVHTFQKLSQKPDLLFVDGHGISHPRGLGIASHLGVILDIPTIGVAKSILVGAPQTPLAPAVGSTTPLLWKGKEIGLLLRSKKNCRPLIISAGHKITLPTALRWVQKCLKGYRLPEPTRQAHLAANLFRKQMIYPP